MGKTRDTGFLGNCVFTDSSNNVGIGAAASGSYKLQVTGTTNLTGALSGTSATFSGALGAKSLSVNETSANSYGILSLVGSSRGGEIDFYDGATIGASIYGGTGSDKSLYFTTNGGSSVRLTLASTGAATFSSSVTAKGFLYLGEAAVENGVINSPEGIYINADSDNSGGANDIVFGKGRTSTSGGTTFMTIKNGGNVGIGTSSPANLLHLAGASATPSLRLSSSANTAFYWDIGRENASTGDFVFNSASGGAATERMRITSGGNVGIGTSSPAYPLEITKTSGDVYLNILRASKSTGQVALRLAGGTSGTNWVIYQDTNADDLQFYGNGAERMRITSGGNVLIGTTSNVGQRLRVYQPTNGEWNIKLIQPNSSSINYQEFLTTTDGDASNTARGSITYNGTNVLYNGTSDYRMKEDLQEFDALNIISQLKSYDFKWKEAGTRDYGMMAHELQEILPNYVTGQKDELNQDGSIKPQGVDYSKIVPILVKSIQELEKRIKQLENK